MGKDVSFLHGYQNAGDHSCLENLAYYLANIYDKVDVQSSKLVKNDTEYSVYDT